MSPALIAACLWVLAATLTALLPLRLQYAPGLALLIAAPPLLIWIGAVHGPVIAGAATLAWISFFRRPLGYFARRAMRAGGGR